jgi:hypothetical protein
MPLAMKDKGVMVHAMDGPRTDVSSCALQIIFPTLGAVFAEDAAILDFHSAGNAFDLILGRSFLCMCRLNFDPLAGLYHLDWHGG